MAPGESRSVQFTASATAFSCVDSASGDFTLTPGTFTIEIGDVVQPAVHTLAVTGDRVVTGVNRWAHKLVSA